MSIKLRLIILALVSLLVVGALGSIGYIGNDRLNTNMHDSNQLSELRVLVNLDGQLLNIHNQYLLTLQHNPADPEISSMHDHEISMHIGNIKKFEEAILKRLDQFNSHPASVVYQEEAEAFQTSVSTYFESVNRGTKLYNEGKYRQANLVLLEQMNPQINAAVSALGAFRGLLVSHGEALQKSTKELSDTLTNLLLLIGLAGFIFMGAMAWVIVASVQKGIKETVEGVRKVSTSMDFNSQLPSRKDELNDVSTALNNMLADMKQGISEANAAVGSIANGDFNTQIRTEMRGDLNLLKDGVNASAKSVAFMMDELSKVMAGIQDGQFDLKMDKDVPEAFSRQVEAALGSIDLVINQINSVMGYMSQGQFEHRVEAKTNGQLDVMKTNINQSMDALEQAINDIKRVVMAQAEGDLTQTITAVYSGDLKELTDAINISTEKLTDIVSKAIQTSNTVSDSAKEVSQGALDLSQRVQQQAAALEQTSATMDEMNSAVQNNTENAKEASIVARDVQQKATQGSQVMQQTIEAMNSIQQSSHKISEIVTLIDGIAFQTNLLALNAAVEAARAGDHGRGFAVVAGEVRALAQKSAEAAKDISALINESVTRIDQGTKLASESGDMLGSITHSVEEVTKMIEQIADASQEQAEGVNQVHLAVADIDQVTQQNAALVEETSAASESMSEQADTLSRDMAFFKTNQTASLSKSTHTKPAQDITVAFARKAALPNKAIKLKSTSPTTQKSARIEQSDEWSEF